MKNKESNMESVKTATVKSSVFLTDKQREEIKARLEKIFGEKIAVVNEIEKKLLGGFTVQLGDWYLDASLSLDLHKIKEALS